jgi:hypothetical protein
MRVALAIFCDGHSLGQCKPTLSWHREGPALSYPDRKSRLWFLEGCGDNQATHQDASVRFDVDTWDIRYAYFRWSSRYNHHRDFFPLTRFLFAVKFTSHHSYHARSSSYMYGSYSRVPCRANFVWVLSKSWVECVLRRILWRLLHRQLGIGYPVSNMDVHGLSRPSLGRKIIY